MAEPDELTIFLKKCKLFQNLSPDELSLLLPLINRQTFEKNSSILHEGEQGDDLFLIKKGSVEILKTEKDTGADFQLTILYPEDSFGEMAILGTKTRLASAKALEKTEVMVLHLKDIEDLIKKTPSFFKILINAAKKGVYLLETANEMTVKSLKEELRLTKTHDHMSRFIIHLFILLTFFVYALKFFNQYEHPHAFFSYMIPSLLIIAIALSSILIVKQSGYPIEFYGVSFKNWKKNVFESTLFTIPILVIMIGLKWILIKTTPEFSHLSMFDLGTLSDAQKESHFNFFLLFYVILVPVQEFIARGCLQSSLRNFFTGHHCAFLAILTSNLLFLMFHGFKSFSFAFTAFLLGIFWGWIYERQKTIVGPSISHILVGILGFGFLHYQSILIY